MDEIQKKLLQDQTARTKFAQDLAIEQMRRAQMNPEQLEQYGFNEKQKMLNFQKNNPLAQQPTMPVQDSMPQVQQPPPMAPHDPTMDAILEQLLRKR